MRDFYDRQDHAQEETFYLVGLLIFGSILVVVATAFLMAAAITGFCFVNVYRTVNGDMPPGWFRENFMTFLMSSSVISTLIVVGNMARRMWQVNEAGAQGIAEGLGGKRVLDLDAREGERTLLNVVEELAIAAGIRRPGLYVIDDPAINGFAAGWDERGAVVAVTRGAMDRLNREQLQGVIAHEFSHIIKKDIALNTRLVGGLAGLRALSSTADWCLGLNNARSKGMGMHPMGGAFLMVIGVALYPIGRIGELFASLIVCEVNRQREYLADAHAVELTRNPRGLRQALELIAADEIGGRVEVGGPEVGHLFFTNSVEGKTSWFSSHPPLEERISRLGDEPSPPVPQSQQPEAEVALSV